MRYFIDFAYRGTNYSGSQSQPNGTTVQSVLEQAFATILRVPVPLTFAGRTDAGVHARQMIAHFDYGRSADMQTGATLSDDLVRRLNSLLPWDIAVHRIYPVADDAHARFDATARTYHYYITPRKDPFAYNLAALVTFPLDFSAMNMAADMLLGTHDFASFCKVHTDVKTTLCTITHAQWTALHSGDFSCGAVFTITANRFLRNMVRAVVGTLFEVGRHRITIPQFQEIIDAHNRCRAGQSAPAEGLYLMHIEYPELGIGLTEKMQ